jgi:hypothetical protein
MGMLFMLALLCGFGGLMVQKLGGPSAAIEAVKPPLRTVMGAVGLQAYAPVGLVDADAVLNKKKKKSKPKPAKTAALPAAPPAPPKKKFSAALDEYNKKEKAATPKTKAVALQKMPVKKKGLHRLIFGGVKEVLTNLKGKVVKRKDPPTKK